MSQEPPIQPQLGQPELPPVYQQSTPSKKSLTKKSVGIGCSILVVLIALCGIFSVFSRGTSTSSIANSSTNQTTDQPTSTPQPQPTAKIQPTQKVATVPQFNDGNYIVGKDIHPGTYRTRDGSPGCYFARLKGFSGTTDDILANANTDTPSIVTISASDKGFQSNRCGTWTQDLSAITTKKTSFNDGMYIIGTDIEPGTYKSSGQSGCYYARLQGFGGTNDDIISNDNTDTSAIVTISASDKGFQSNRCGTWTKE